MRKQMRGITLIELMVVVIIVGILTSIAFPNYRAYVARAKRGEAKEAVLRCAINQEKWYLQSHAFTTDLTKLGFKSPFKTDSGYYLVTVGTTDPTNDFTCTATYQATDTESAKCKSLAIDSTGNKTSSPDADCWAKTR
ncbi:MAG: type IV pilin protein [Gammaproteobacteria bacterium]|nr:type IV pilin protein [Gammaproteobacteria bacterium]